MNHTFAIITIDKQQAFETICEGIDIAVNIPEICGHYGRACRQMEKNEGANRAICTMCPLAKFCEE